MKTCILAALAVATALLLQACAVPLRDAPAPCASIEHDCGPAKPLNESFARVASPARAVTPSWAV